METDDAVCTPVVKERLCKFGSAIQSIVSTFVRRGKLRVERIVMPFRPNVSVIVSRVSPESEVICVTLLAIKLPLITWIPSSAMLSVVLVAMAMLPVNVSQLASAEASP